MAVQSVLEELEINYISIELGKVKLAAAISPEQQKKIGVALKHYELELMGEKKTILVERIKIVIIEMFHSPDMEKQLKFSEYLSQRLDYDYTYLANTFSEQEGSTIEKFYIMTRIERVKELIVYEEMSTKDSAHQMNYSSVAHLCHQFKKVTGETLSAFRKQCGSPGYVWKMCE
jgi:AraC-like DNA-binding protein